jgi:ribose-phosphate pyrophosphokinase
MHDGPTDSNGMPFNLNGGLTLVPMPGFVEQAHAVKELVEKRGMRDGMYRTPVDIATASFGEHSNGDPYVDLTKHHIGEHDCVILTSGPGTYKMLMQLILLIGYLDARKAARITIVLGYFPLSRSDKDEGDSRLALIRMLINVMKGVAPKVGIYRIVAADPHSPQIAMAGEPGDVTPVILTRRLLSPMIVSALEQNDRICIAYPDDGAAKNFEAAAIKMEVTIGLRIPYVTGVKRRDDSNKSRLIAVQGQLDAVKDATVIQLDDEIATGGSVINLGWMLKQKYGAKSVWVGVTHGVFCGPAIERFSAEDSPIDQLTVMDTIPIHNRSDTYGLPSLDPLLQSGRLQVTSWVEDLSWVIYRNHWDLSIRQMR